MLLKGLLYVFLWKRTYFDFFPIQNLFISEQKNAPECIQGEFLELIKPGFMCCL